MKKPFSYAVSQDYFSNLVFNCFLTMTMLPFLTFAKCKSSKILCYEKSLKHSNLTVAEIDIENN